MAESITSGTLSAWEKAVGDWVDEGDNVASIETDKVEIPVNSPVPGTIRQLYAKVGETVEVGCDLFRVELGNAPAPKKEVNGLKESSGIAKQEAKKEERVQLAQPPVVNVEAKEKQPVVNVEAKEQLAQEKVHSRDQAQQQPLPHPIQAQDREQVRVPMSRMRLRIAEKLQESQRQTASLTTFNEVDMSAIQTLRSQLKDEVLQKFGVKLGYMSFFVKASAIALAEIPAVNAQIQANDALYHNYADICVAVATPKGLVTPVVKDCHSLSLLQIEQQIAALALKAKEGKISLEELTGGTFTISNGGVFGSLSGTPILNYPQAAILGMHAIKQRPIVLADGAIVARPMMNLALTYDHRIIDGREAVSFLVRVKQLLEEPSRFLFTS